MGALYLVVELAREGVCYQQGYRVYARVFWEIKLSHLTSEDYNLISTALASRPVQSSSPFIDLSVQSCLIVNYAQTVVVLAFCLQKTSN